ncbi:MAG: ribosome biogenesis GTPase Der [Anaerosomatales bacterium]|nr:ribosome biogenesis GTPase Der [Coriobacteriia bacterium]MDI6692929.1 ribosome biogenesis GTPase Der [Anaerosomatales bacterium]
MALPLVAVVGRPNVGKSTFVNRIAQRQDAIVHAQSGVTRDRSYHRADWNGTEFMLIDTGGIELQTDDAFGPSIRAQAVRAASEADVVVFLVDGKTGLAPGDEDVAHLLRRGDKPVFLVVNKVDDPGREEAVHEFWALGLGQPWPVSALHGHGTGDLLDAIVGALPPARAAEEVDAIDVAIIGRPNAGKSSLYNRLVGAERAIVSDVAGTTRDAIDTLVERDGLTLRLIDTAGLRRKSQIDDSVEYYGFVRAMRAIDRAQVALLVIDSTLGVTDQDQRVARFAEERGCGMVVLLNKWDAVAGPERKSEIAEQAGEKLSFVSYAPVLRVSALTGAGTTRIFDAVAAVWQAYSRHIPTSQLNRLLTDIKATGHTVSKGKRHLKLAYVTQTRSEPPEFTFFVNHPDLVEPSYERYLENRLRQTFDLTGTPIRLAFRKKA